MPFTHDQFLDVFGAFNSALWPAALALWVATAWALVAWIRRGEAASRMLAGLLAFHWAWSAVAYHLAFFRAINPAATLFALLFLAQAALFLWLGVARSKVRWRLDLSPTGILGAALAVYGMAYPAINLALGLEYPRMPAFGVPCPTTLVTAGVLVAAVPRPPRIVFMIPVLWSVVAGSAAWLLGIRADFALFAAGLLLLARTIGMGIAHSNSNSNSNWD